MTKQQIKLDLTLNLISQAHLNKPKEVIKKVLRNIKEAGNFLGEKLIGQKVVGEDWLNQTYALQFEAFTLNVELVESRKTNTEVLRGFHFK